MQNLRYAYVPVGTVVFFARSTPPSGFLHLNGAAISRTTYSALYSKVGIQYGSGDGSTTFNLPDLRGLFLRGFQSGGTYYAADNVPRTWPLIWMTNTLQNTYSYTHYNVYQGKTYYSSFTGNQFTGYWGTGATGIGLMWNGWDDLRPHNIALLACVKY
jgi:phage-related tail fiber protein